MLSKRYGQPIDGCLGYTVTRAGSVYSHRHRKPKKLKPYLHDPGGGRKPLGHLKVKLQGSTGRVTAFVHVLVARAHLDAPPFAGALVLHRDGNPRNNRVENLRWGSYQDNANDMIRHGTQVRGSRVASSVLDASMVREIRERVGWGESIAVVAKRFPVSYSAVRRAAIGQTWQHV